MRIRDCSFTRQNEFELETGVMREHDTKVARFIQEKANKSERRMPRLLEAKKDVVSCENGRGSANRK